ncbi:MAG TPA: hypothetical protein VIK73_00750 [Limnochordales bacterium]
MKKLAVVLSALLVAALSVPTLAAGFELSGSLEGDFTWRQQATDEGPRGLSTSTELTIGAQTGTAERGLRAEVTASPVWYPGLTDSTASINITRAFIEAKGQLWRGGEPATARIGSLDVAYSPYIGQFAEEGLSISGLGFGPVGLSAFAGRDVAVSRDNTVVGAQLRAALPAAGLAATAVNVNGRYDLELAAAAMPMPGVTVSGIYARSETSGSDVPQLSRIDAQAQIRPDLTVAAGYRKVWNTFMPVYRAFDEDGNEYGWLADNRGEHGVTVAVNTVQHGVNVAGGVDLYEKWVDEDGKPIANPTQHREIALAAATNLRGAQVGAATQWDLLERAPIESSLSVAYPVAMPGLMVVPAYKATLYGTDAVKHELSAEATVDVVPQMPGIGLSGRLTRETDGQLTWGAGVRYTAPSGLSVAVEHDSQDGAKVEAGIKASF